MIPVTRRDGVTRMEQGITPGLSRLEFRIHIHDNVIRHPGGGQACGSSFHF